MTKITKGSCNCGGVSWKAKGDMRPVIACHCGQCRKQTGMYYAATNVADDKFTVTGEENLTWYQSSDVAKRGFCKHCDRPPNACGGSQKGLNATFVPVSL